MTWLMPDGKPLLTETRKTTFHSHPELRIVDFDFDFAAIDKVVFRDTKEGTFALRMAGALDELQSKDTRDPASRGKLTNAQGGAGEANVWGKRSAWVDYSGTLDGEKVGIVMMDHPGQSAASHLLAFARLRPALHQPVRRARFSQRQEPGRQPDASAG